MTITTLFLDIGGVLLTNGWDKPSRKLAAKTFNLDFHEMESRHQLTFDTYELGKMNLKEYLGHVVFYQPRSFTFAQFQAFIFSQSKPYPQMLDFIRRLKAQYGLKIGVVSNEAFEINAYRIKTFKLNNFVDFFISSCFVHLRKPDAEIFRLALDIAQTPVRQIIYIEDRPIFVNIAENVGIHSICHTGYSSTRAQLAQRGLSL